MLEVNGLITKKVSVVYPWCSLAVSQRTTGLTHFMPLMVRDVAAMFVATTHFLIPEGGGWKICLCWSATRTTTFSVFFCSIVNEISTFIAKKNYNLNLVMNEARQRFAFTCGHGSIKGQNKKALHGLVLHVIAVVYGLCFFIQQVTRTLNLHLTCQTRRVEGTDSVSFKTNWQLGDLPVRNTRISPAFSLVCTSRATFTTCEAKRREKKKNFLLEH